MERVAIKLSLNQESYRFSVDKTTPLIDQVKRYLSLVSEEKQNRLVLVFNAAILSSTDTVTNLSINDGDEIEGYHTIPMRNADQRLVNHIRQEGYNASRFTYIAPDIAGYTIR